VGSTRRGTIPSTLEEAYGLRDASVTPEGRAFYQEHVYRLRAEWYRSQGIRTKESVRQRERIGAEALRVAKDSPVPWWKRMLGGRR
jgi:hypothetical protein